MGGGGIRAALDPARPLIRHLPSREESLHDFCSGPCCLRVAPGDCALVGARCVPLAVDDSVVEGFRERSANKQTAGRWCSPSVAPNGFGLPQSNVSIMFIYQNVDKNNLGFNM